MKKIKLITIALLTVVNAIGQSYDSVKYHCTSTVSINIIGEEHSFKIIDHYLEGKVARRDYVSQNENNDTLYREISEYDGENIISKMVYKYDDYNLVFSLSDSVIYNYNASNILSSRFIFKVNGTGAEFPGYTLTGDQFIGEYFYGDQTPDSTFIRVMTIENESDTTVVEQLNKKLNYYSNDTLIGVKEYNGGNEILDSVGVRYSKSRNVVLVDYYAFRDININTQYWEKVSTSRNTFGSLNKTSTGLIDIEIEGDYLFDFFEDNLISSYLKGANIIYNTDGECTGLFDGYGSSEGYGLYNFDPEVTIDSDSLFFDDTVLVNVSWSLEDKFYWEMDSIYSYGFSAIGAYGICDYMGMDVPDYSLFKELISYTDSSAEIRLLTPTQESLQDKLNCNGSTADSIYFVCNSNQGEFAYSSKSTTVFAIYEKTSDSSSNGSEVVSDTTVFDTIVYAVVNSNFEMYSDTGRTYWNDTKVLTRSNGADSTVVEYLQYIYAANTYSDTIEVHDTVEVYDTMITELFDTNQVSISVEDTLNITLTISTGTDELEDELKVWSNGSSIYFESSKQEGYAFELISITGIKVLDVDDTSISNSISLDGIALGTYIAKFTSLTDSEVSITKKIVVR